MTPEERKHRARLGAHTSWANTTNPSARTAPAREAALGRFEKEVDPDGVLLPEERARRAKHAKAAFYARIQMLSAKKRAERSRDKRAA